jgi:hypothetical protein
VIRLARPDPSFLPKLALPFFQATSIALNLGSPLFHADAPLRRALNYAVDRADPAAALGRYGATPWSHLLTPGIPGPLAAQPYQAHADLARAAGLARGHLRGRSVTVYYRASSAAEPKRAAAVHAALVGLGFAPRRVVMKGFTGGDIYTAMGKQPRDWDVAAGAAFCDSERSGFGRPDPADILRPFAGGSPSLRAAQRLHGRARLRALGRLDLRLTGRLAPMVVTDVRNMQFLFSARDDLATLAYQSAVENWSLASLALK